MAWTVNVTLDEDKADVGTVSATWTDATYGSFSISQRRQVSIAEADAFIGDAIAARNTWQTRMAENVAKGNFVLDRLNAADGQVV